MSRNPGRIDEDPGWPGIEECLSQKIPVDVIRALLKEKRDREANQKKKTVNRTAKRETTEAKQKKVISKASSSKITKKPNPAEKTEQKSSVVVSGPPCTSFSSTCRRPHIIFQIHVRQVEWV